MRMHNVVGHPTRLSQNLKRALQIIQFRPESENIDDVDPMTELTQLLCLLPHECPVPRPLGTGIHVRNKEDSHDPAPPSLKSSQTGMYLRICQCNPVKLYGLFDHSRDRKLASQPRLSRFPHTSCNVRIVE